VFILSTPPIREPLPPLKTYAPPRFVREGAPQGAKSETGPPMTLGSAAAARLRLLVWCKACQHQVAPDPGEMAARYGAATSVLDWHERLVCSRCGSRQSDMVVTGTKGR
jgi:hypothetical protein